MNPADHAGKYELIAPNIEAPDNEYRQDAIIAVGESSSEDDSSSDLDAVPETELHGETEPDIVHVNIGGIDEMARSYIVDSKFEREEVESYEVLSVRDGEQHTMSYSNNKRTLVHAEPVDQDNLGWGDISDDDSSDGLTVLTWPDVFIQMDADRIMRYYNEKHDIQDAEITTTKDYYGEITTVKIPTNATEALGDFRFGSCWLMAMENEMERKHRKKYAFETLMTIPEGRIVMRGNWVYCSTADLFTAKIIFTARWVRMSYNTIRAIKYMNTHEDVPLKTIDVLHEPTTFAGTSIGFTPPRARRPPEASRHRVAVSAPRTVTWLFERQEH